jgi:hypothetical protein
VIRLKLGQLSLALALTMSYSASAAEELTAGTLFEFCGSIDEVAQTACRFYILGAVQGVSLGDGSTEEANGHLVQKAKTIFCIPEGVSEEQMIAVFQDAVRPLAGGHPEDMELPALGVLSAAMTRAFPCPSR